LGDVAHARAGDKGNDCLLVVAPYDPEDFEPLLSALTAERVGAHFGASEPGRVTITPAPVIFWTCASRGGPGGPDELSAS
jgi:hypothetical protein